MKRILVISIVAVLMSTALTRCDITEKPAQATPHAPRADSTLDRVMNTGVLRVGYFLFEPAIMQDPGSKKLRGVFIDEIEQLAKDMRWRVEYKQVDLKNFGAALQSRDFDLSIGATFSSPSRASGVTFTDPLFYLGYTGVAHESTAGRFRTWADVDRKGVRVAVKQGSAIGDYARRNFKNATIVALEEPALSAPLAAVPSQADIGLMNEITVYTFLRDNPQAKLKEVLTSDPAEFTGICWAVRRGDADWLAFINTAIHHYQTTGRVAEWERKYSIPYMYHPVGSYEYRTSNGTSRTAR